MERFIEELKNKPNISNVICDSDKLEVVCDLKIEKKCKDEYIKDSFTIKISFLDCEIPQVFELSRKLKPNYRHMYPGTNRLCLATDLEQKIYLKSNSLSEWLDEYVEKYFLSYIYYQRYGVFPFGEHTHGVEGLYEFLQERWKTQSIQEAKNIFEFVCTREYRGHFECPCGSGKKIRNCHKDLILSLLKNEDELTYLKESYRRFEDVGRNR